MTPEQRHDQIKKRKAQIERLTRKLARMSKTLRTRIQKAKRSLAALERAQAKAGVDGAGIDAAREQAADMEALERFVGKPKAPPPPSHFVIHADPRRWRSRPGTYGHESSVRLKRTICGGYVAESEGFALRKDAIVTCLKCMEYKAAWLALPKRKPLTLRRAKELRASTMIAVPGGGCDAITALGPVEHKTTGFASANPAKEA